MIHPLPNPTTAQKPEPTTYRPTIRPEYPSVQGNVFALSIEDTFKYRMDNNNSSK